MAADTVNSVYDNMCLIPYSRCPREHFRFLRRVNKYIDETTPWVLGKDEGRGEIVLPQLFITRLRA